MVTERDREKKLFTTKQIIDVTIKINLCGRLPGKKIPIQLATHANTNVYYSIYNTTKSNLVPSVL